VSRIDEGKAINPGMLRHRIYIQSKTEGAQNELRRLHGPTSRRLRRELRPCPAVS
jgi:hypothetical protein